MKIFLLIAAAFTLGCAFGTVYCLGKATGIRETIEHLKK